MKVTLTYDFRSENIEDFSKDKVEINLSYNDYMELRSTLFDCALELIGKEESLRAMEVYKKLHVTKWKSIV